MKPTISVIMPIYNQPQVVDFFLRLNIENADGIVEWVIIDNASDKKTKDILRDLGELAESKNHIWSLKQEEENTGVARAWNSGLQLAKSDFICILNNDCFFGYNWVSRMLEAFKNSKLDIFTPYIVEPGMNHPPNTPENFIANYEKWQRRNRRKIRRSLFSGVAICGLAQTFRQIGGFDEAFWLSHEDIDFLLRAKKEGLGIGIVGEIMGFHNVSATRKNVATKEDINGQKFQEKWQFDYTEVSALKSNKLIRSWQKRLWYYRHKMSALRQKLPIQK